MSKPAPLRCAIYTRKSSEEGLQQDFNSLDAQREACEAYIKSQASLGWRSLAARYDDGGISGGTLERPALQKLLADVQSGKVDVVVVYKIDRLTRSLTDFAKIVEVFEARQASFVSVTQAFNTTSSMGRLTLNVLLSFAQFEREVTGERIRDKIAASKRKGMWMGGVVPLGYAVEDRKLVISSAEAATVQQLFALYLEAPSVRELQRRATALGLQTGPRVSTRSNGISGGRPFSCGHLRAILSNPIYIGRIRHGNQCFDGQHEPIIDPSTFDQVQDLLRSRANRSVTPQSRDGLHLLSGLLFDESGDQLAPTHATKAGKRYRYYVSRRLMSKSCSDPAEGWRIPTRQIEALVCQQLTRFLRSQPDISEMSKGWSLTAPQLQRLFQGAGALADQIDGEAMVAKKSALHQLVCRIDLRQQSITIHLATAALTERCGLDLSQSPDPVAHHSIKVPAALRRRGVEARLVVGNSSPAPDQRLIRLIARSHLYMRALTDNGTLTIADLAEREQLDVSDLSRILRLAFLAPDLTEAILTGAQPPELTSHQLMRVGELSASWNEQRRQLFI